MAKKTEDKCSFCGRSRNEVQFLIAGIDALICEDCTKQANRIISEDSEVKTSTPLNKLVLLKPAQIKALPTKSQTIGTGKGGVTKPSGTTFQNTGGYGKYAPPSTQVKTPAPAPKPAAPKPAPKPTTPAKKK